MHPNRIGLRTLAFYKIGVEILNGQVIRFKRFGFDYNTLNGLFLTVCRFKNISRFQAARFNPFAVCVERVDFVGNQCLILVGCVCDMDVNRFCVGIAVLCGYGFIAGFAVMLVF